MGFFSLFNKKTLYFDMEMVGEKYERVDLTTIECGINYLDESTDNFIILSPHRPVQGSTFLQAALPAPGYDDGKGYIVEIKMEQENGDGRQYRYRTKEKDEVRRIFADYYNKKLPVLENWTDITGELENSGKLFKVIRAFKEKTILPCIELSATREDTTPFDSKLGGMPYIPKGFEYPYNTNEKSEKKPLKLLAQLNFGKLPNIEGFPEKGILQFYIAYEEDSDTYGADFSNPTAQKGFRVVYHENVIEDYNALGDMPVIEENPDYPFPFEGEFMLTGIKTTDSMGFDDYRFSDEFIKVYNSYMSPEISSLSELDESVLDLVSESTSNAGNIIGGYADFTQYDPRDCSELLEKYTVTLLQIDSIDGVMWGDSGIANFFIKPEALKKCDFSDILYNWDCY